MLRKTHKKVRGVMPKSQRVGKTKTLLMEQMNLHKQKLYALIIAGVALVALMLPWLSVNVFGASSSVNGFRSWGILLLVGIGGIAALCFTGDRQQGFLPEQRNLVLGAFGAIALGALLFLLRKNSISGGMFSDMVSTGIGLWLCLIAGLVGLGITLGFIKIGASGTSKP